LAAASHQAKGGRRQAESGKRKAGETTVCRPPPSAFRFQLLESYDEREIRVSAAIMI
jgi:hypothetical protein